MRGAWTQYLFIILVVGFSALSWIVRKLQEQAAKKQAEERQKRHIEEMLRTGRVEGEQAESPEAAREREILERRRAQIEELRRRARERGARTGQPRAEGPIVVIPGSSGPIVIQGGLPARPVGAPVPQRRVPPQQRQRDREQVKAAARQQREPQRPHAVQRPVEIAAPRAAPPPPDPGRAARAVIRGRPLTPSDLQQAIVMRELLGPPVSLRGPEGVF